MDLLRQRVERRGHVFAARQMLCLCLLSMTSGCHVFIPFSAAVPDASARSCTQVVACQIVTDSCVALARHPLRGGSELLYSEGDRLCASLRGEVGKRVVMPLQGTPNSLAYCSRMFDPDALPQVSGAPPDRCPEPVEIRLYTDGTEALAALEDMVAKAVHRIDIVMFLWEDDRVGRAIASWLAAKASPDLRIRVLVDGGGNLIFGRAGKASAGTVNQAVLALAQQPYIEVVRVRNPFARLDHRKMVLVDGRVAWTGGRNFADRFFQQHDLSFTLTGPLVAQLQDQYERYWREQGGGPPVRGSPPMTSDHGSETAPKLSNAWAFLVATEPLTHELGQTLYRAVDRAKQYICMENVYLVDSLLLYKLAQARRRGVDVRVVMTLDSPERVINGANRMTANRLLRAGVRVYLYPGMTHVKAATVDGGWAYLGTGNFDELSLRHNREFGLSLGAGPVIRELEERLFFPDFRTEWELTGPLPVSLKDCVYEWVASRWL